jgi:methylase of polypeptide subunit release factors
MPEAAARLRACLRAAGYTDPAVCERLGVESIVAVETLHRPYYVHQRLRPQDPQAALIRLFLLQQPVPEPELQPALGPAGITLLLDLGLAVRRDGVMHPCVDLYPYDGDWFATDRADQAGEGGASGRYDAVMPLNMSSHTLARLALPIKAERALDIGTGCGVHAIRAARRAGSVVATDLNARALQFAAFNAALNGVTNVELREGSLWEPVAGETFDLILANPAFTLSARTDYLFRDGGARGDRMTAALLSGAAAHLREGGIAQIIGEFPTLGEHGFEEQVEAWVGEAPCDRLLLRFGAMEPLEYAVAYAHEPFGQDAAAYETALAARLEAFAALGATDVVLGAVLLRRRQAASHWVVRRVLAAPGEPLGPSLAALVRELDRWESPEAAALLWAGTPRLVRGLRLTETRRREPSGWIEKATRAGVEGNPLCSELRLSGPARDLLLLCDGSRTGAAVSAAFAAAYQVEDGEAAETTLAFLRELAEQGLIEVEGEAAGTSPPGRLSGATRTGHDPAGR